MSVRHYQMFARYNAWANTCLYNAANKLSPTQYNEDRGVFFGSLHRTLAHILVADRLWLHRFSQGKLCDAPKALDEVPHETFEELWAARQDMDNRIISFTESLTPEILSGRFRYTTIGEDPNLTMEQDLEPTLAHFFNHQTHHRGQASGILTGLGCESVVMDLVYFLHQEGKEYANAKVI
eukprot:comp17562_c0_seq1/m.17162 comp17562_c0_seq1/g.17162  ORF comp17562_c0_seq1/g.17162 comp17562_c0_seq1/m.17162 type:complete len:180 (-) comp17562_c0_seq1:35-574(-)